MNVNLLYKDKDFDFNVKISELKEILIKDLGLEIVFKNMSENDSFVYDIVRKVLIFYENDRDTILYRQEILKDVINNSSVINEIIEIAKETLNNKKRMILGILSVYPSSILMSSVRILEMLLFQLKKLRNIAKENLSKFNSEGFTKLFNTLIKSLNDQFFKEINSLIYDLKFKNGYLLKVKLSTENENDKYIIVREKKKNTKNIKYLIMKLIKKLPFSFIKNSFKEYEFKVSYRDETGMRILANIVNIAVNDVADVVAQTVDYILHFFNTLLYEMSFYSGCFKLYQKIKRIGMPVTFPEPVESENNIHYAEEIYDLSLMLTVSKKVVSNNLNAENKRLIIITGANKGGKSTFLRSIGIAQILMQSGLFVPAKVYRANINKKIFTHFRKEEDMQLKSGKFDEELKRMSEIIDNLKKNSLILLNESFSSTNELEGSEIALQIVKALIEKDIKIFFVTHLYRFSFNILKENRSDIIFLRAERKDDGTRTFRIIEGKPLPTSFGKDLYYEIFDIKEYKKDQLQVHL